MTAMQILAYIFARFSEPSSYAGLGAALALLGVHLADPALAELTQLLAAACGFMALLLKERGLIPVILLALSLAPVLSACGGIAATDPTIATACTEYGKGNAAAGLTPAILPADIAAQVAAIEGFGDAACADPPAGDPLTTVIWLGQLAGQIGTLTKRG
jgi:hypothetical protein